MPSVLHTTGFPNTAAASVTSLHTALLCQEIHGQSPLLSPLSYVITFSFQTQEKSQNLQGSSLRPNTQTQTSHNDSLEPTFIPISLTKLES